MLFRKIKPGSLQYSFLYLHNPIDKSVVIWKNLNNKNVTILGRYLIKTVCTGDILRKRY